MKRIISLFSFRNKLLGIFTLGLRLVVLDLKLIDCVSDLSLVTHAVGIGSIDVSTV